MPNDLPIADYDAATGWRLPTESNLRVAPPVEAKRKNYIIEPDLYSYQTGNYVPEGATVDETGALFWKDTKEPIQIIRRPTVLPVVGTPDGNEMVMPKLADLAGYVMGPLAAGKVPVKAGEMVLGSGAVRSVTEAPKVAPPFYSGLERAVEAAKPSIATPDQWLGYLKNQPGVKAEELQHVLGELPQGPITKEALVDIVKNNKVELKEVVKGEYKPDNLDFSKYSKELEDNSKKIFGKSYDELVDSQQQQIRNATFKEQEISPTKFHQWQLPGGENYKEMLLTLPEKEITNEQALTEAKRFSKHLGEDWNRIPADTQERYVAAARQQLEGNGGSDKNFKSSHWDEPNVLAHIRMNDRQLPKEFTPAEQEALKLHEEAQPKLAANREAQGNVGKEISAASKPLEAKRRADILAEVKAGKLTNAEAMRKLENYEVPAELKPLQDKLEALRKEEDTLRNSLPKKPEQQMSKTLHLEEIQSDWHQKGRKEGYKLNEKDKARLDTNAETVDNKLQAANAEDIMGNPDLDAGLKQAVERKIITQKEADDYKHLVKNENGTVPDAPFKKNWDELALKRAIRHAAENGYDAISWTPGEAQAARYDLSKQVKTIDWMPSPAAKDHMLINLHQTNGGDIKLQVDKKGNVQAGFPGSQTNQFEGKHLSDIVGKEVTEKIFKKMEAAKPYEPITELPENYHLIHDANGKAKKQEWGIIPEGQSHARSFTGRYHATEEEAKKEALEILNQTAKRKHDAANSTLENMDLRIGGEGMKSFYDKMLVDKANALAKKYGAKVEQKDLAGTPNIKIRQATDTGGGWEVYNKDTGEILHRTNGKDGAESFASDYKKQPVHYLPLTKELKDKAMKEGFPLFTSSPVLVPVDHDPFNSNKKYKLVPVQGNPFNE